MATLNLLLRKHASIYTTCIIIYFWLYYVSMQVYQRFFETTRKINIITSQKKYIKKALICLQLAMMFIYTYCM